MPDDLHPATDVGRPASLGARTSRATVAPPPRVARPSHERLFSIRPALIALVVACVLPSLGAFGIVVAQDYRQQQREIERETLLQARALASTVDRELGAVEATLRFVAAMQRGVSSDAASFGDRVRAAPPLPLVIGYALVDRDGRRIADTRRGARALRAAALAPLFERRERTWSSGGDDPSTAAPVLAVPVVRNGDAVLAVAADLSTTRLASLLANATLPAGWTATLVDRAGTVVARAPDRASGAPPANGAAELFGRLASAPEGTFEGLGPDGGQTTASHARSSLSDLVVVVEAPRSALLARLANALGGLAAAGVVMLGAALWIALRLAGAVTRSVEGLIEPALALGTGGAVELPTTRVKEVHAVGQALAEAARMLAAAKHQAHHDALTGLCNRLLFDEVAFHQFASARRAGRRLALLAIDLDGFKAVNDRHGHAAGDAVLRLAAERIQRTIRASDVVSRRGGDEFTVLLGDVGQVLTRQIGEKLVAALAEPYPGVAAPVSASIGIAIFPESGTTVDELLARADEALYAAKHAGKRRVSGDV